MRLLSCSWEDNGWRSLLVQRCVHPSVLDLRLPGAPDVHLILAEAGRTTMEKDVGGRRTRFIWAPGWLEMNVPGEPGRRRYQAEGPLRSAQVDLPRATVEQAAEQLDGGTVDYESMAASISAGDPFLEEAIRTVAAANEASDLYAESAAAFLAAHLVSHHSGRHVRPTFPVREDARVRSVIALMRERLTEQLTLSDIACEVHLSVFHLVRVFKEATGETPHRFLTRLRLEEAQRLLRSTDLPIAEIAPRCGFASPGALSAAFLRHTGVRPSAYRNV